MAKTRSEVSRYPSKYSPKGWVTSAQFICELLCEKKAANKGDGDLPLQFWKQKEWQAYFAFQSKHVNKLLETYDPEAIINAIKKRNIWSAGAKWVDKVIAKEQREIDAAKAAAKREKVGQKPKSEGIIGIPRERTKRLGTTSLDKLLALEEELENGEKGGC